MSYAESVLDFMLYAESETINWKKSERIKNQCRRNLKAQIGEKIRCPICRRAVIKQTEEQVTCGRRVHNERVKFYVENILAKWKQENNNMSNS